MGGNPRYDTWPPSRWRGLAPTVADLRREGWPVHAACMTCGLEMKVDLTRIARDRGPGFVLWGQTSPCRKLRCAGRAMFLVSPPRANGPVPML